MFRGSGYWPKPPESIKGLSESTVVATIQSGDCQKLIGRWLEKVTTRDMENVQAILDLFPNCPYRADAVQPVRNTKIASWAGRSLGDSSD